MYLYLFMLILPSELDDDYNEPKSIEETHKDNFSDTILELDKDKQPWSNFRKYFVDKYFESVKNDSDFFSVYFYIWDTCGKKWRLANVNTAVLFGGFKEDGGPSHSIVHVPATENYDGFEWDCPNDAWWKPII